LCADLHGIPTCCDSSGATRGPLAEVAVDARASQDLVLLMDESLAAFNAAAGEMLAFALRAKSPTELKGDGRQGGSPSSTWMARVRRYW